MDYYVYTHTDVSSGLVVYVGAGCKGRAWTHGSINNNARNQKHTDWLTRQYELGLIPSDFVTVVKRGLSKSEAHVIETALIDEINPELNRPVGKGNLRVNKTLYDNMCTLRKSGLSYKDISDYLGVSYCMTYKALNGITKEVSKFSDLEV